MTVPLEFTLDNGVTVVYANVPGVKVVSVQSWIKTGSVNETSEISGISHFLEHILFKGTKNFKPGEIDFYLDSKGGSNNAFTSMDVTNYYVTIPVSEAEAAFKVVSDMVFNALFIPEEIEKEKPVVLQEINRKYDKPYYKMQQDFIETIFKGTPYERQVIGEPETVMSFTKEGLTDYYNKFYHPENIILVVVGDIEQDRVLALSNKYFSQTRNVPLGEMYKGGVSVLLEKPVHKVFTAEANVEYAILGFPAEPLNIKTSFCSEVLSEVVSGGEYSLLNQILLLDKHIVSYVGEMSLFNKHNGLFGVFGVMEAGRGEEFKDEVTNILQDISSGNFDVSRVEKAKNRLKSTSVYQQENVSSFANNIGFAYSLDMKEYFLNYVDSVESVSFEDVCKMAKKLTSSNMYFGETIPNNTK